MFISTSREHHLSPIILKGMYLVAVKEFVKDYNEKWNFEKQRQSDTLDFYYETKIHLFFSDGINLYLLEMYYTHYKYDDQTYYGSFLCEIPRGHFNSQDFCVFSQLYEPKKIYLFADYRDNEDVSITIDSCRDIYIKILDLNTVYGSEDMGYRHHLDKLSDYKLRFSPTNEFIKIVGSTIQKQIFTILQVATRGYLLETTGNLKDTDLWLPIELWYIIVDFFY